MSTDGHTSVDVPNPLFATPAPPKPAAVTPWVTLAQPGQGQRLADAPSARAVLWQVVAAALVVLLAVVLVGTVVSRRLAEAQSVTEAAHQADLLATAVVQPALTDALLAGATAQPRARAAFDAVVRRQVLSGTVVRVKLWTPDGHILYSDAASLEGRQFDLGDDETDVLAHPRTIAEVSNLARPENVLERGQGQLLEVYRPVWTPSGRELLFEIYTPYTAVTDRAGQLWRGFAGVTISSLLVLLVLLSPVIWRVLDRSRRLHEQRAVLLQRAVDASDDERRRIAGMLHDGIVQELAATSFTVSSSAVRAEDLGQQHLADQLHQAASSVRVSLRGLRSLLVDIYPAQLATSGLAAALDDLAAVLRARGVVVDVRVDPDAADSLDEDAGRLVHRVAQEWLRNVDKHSGARHVTVDLRREGAVTVLEVDDDGMGFDLPGMLAAPASGHFGLHVLRDLARHRGAGLWVATEPGHGCRWRLEVA